MTTLHSYGLAATASGAKTLHIEQDGAGRALCGVGPVVFVGEVESRWDGEHGWTNCRRCWLLAGPETTSLWDESEEP